MLDKQKYINYKKGIFDDTLKRMKSDSNIQMFSSGGNIYGNLIGILKDVDIRECNLEETFEIMKNLVLTNKTWIQRNRLNASERIRQSFLIAVGLLILIERNKIGLSKEEKENVHAYFKVLKEVYKNPIAIEMIDACFVSDSKRISEDFQKNIWLCNEQELGLFKDFYDVLSINHFNVQANSKERESIF